MRACDTNNCPVGVATQKESLRQRINIEMSAKLLYNFFTATNDLIKVVARSCGHDDVRKFNFDDLSTLNYEMFKLTGIEYAGIKN
jgi:glutamate synthase domain-containing protein 2